MLLRFPTSNAVSSRVDRRSVAHYKKHAAAAAAAALAAPACTRSRIHCPGGRRRRSVAARAAAGGDGGGSSNNNNSSSGTSNTNNTNLPAAPANSFLSLESLLQTALASQRIPGERGDWQEVEGGAWVLFPPQGTRPEAVAHFVGGAFVGAAPQLAYRALLEALARRGAVVIATPYSTTFDHLRASDAVQYSFTRAAAALQAEIAGLPVFGVGHSLGSVLHALISARYAPDRAGNALMAFNNRPATETIPLLSPLVAPYARALGPLLASLSSPALSPLRGAVGAAADALRGLSPALVRQAAPLVEQLAPILSDVSQGRQEFSPPPEKTRELIRASYGVKRTLLLRFSGDSIDETLPLAVLLQGAAAMSASLDISVRTLPGDHVRPMQQSLSVDLPPELARAANEAVAQGSSVLGRLAGFAQQAGVPGASERLDDLRRGAAALADLVGAGGGGSGSSDGSGGSGSDGGGGGSGGAQALADEIAAWMGIGGVVTQGSKALPASSVRGA